MEEYYLQIRHTHIGAITLSGVLFLLRGLALHGFGAAWPMNPWVRYLSYTIDTVLLTAALMLMTITGQYPFAAHWLTVKVLLLAVYIALGIYSFRFAPTRAIRLGSWFAALLIYGFIVTVARTRDPLGFFAGY